MIYSDRIRSFVTADFSNKAKNAEDLVIECLPVLNNVSERDAPIWSTFSLDENAFVHCLMRRIRFTRVKMGAEMYTS